MYFLKSNNTKIAEELYRSRGRAETPCCADPGFMFSFVTINTVTSLPYGLTRCQRSVGALSTRSQPQHHSTQGAMVGGSKKKGKKN